MTTIVTDGKSQEWQDWRDVSPQQSEKVKGAMPYKDLLGDKSSVYSAHLGFAKKGTVVDWDRYDIDEFIYLLKGRLKIEDYDDRKTYIAKPGDFLFHKRGSHLKQTFEEDCETFVIFTPKYDPSMDLPL